MTTFGTPAILLMYGATALERMNRLTAPDWIVWLGDRSDSVYLWHLPVIYVLAGALKTRASARHRVACRRGCSHRRCDSVW